MVSKLMQSVQDQRVLMNEFASTIQITIDETKADPQSLADLVDPDIGSEMITIQFEGWQKLIEFCEKVVVETLKRRDEMLAILNNKA